MDKQVQSIDIMPTILDLLNIPIPNHVEGSSLLNLTNSKAIWKEIAFSERSKFISLRTPSYKLIHSEEGKNELYNLKKDEHELVNIFSVKDVSSLHLSKQLMEWNDEKKIIESRERKSLTKETEEKLRALGYIK